MVDDWYDVHNVVTGRGRVSEHVLWDDAEAGQLADPMAEFRIGHSALPRWY